MGREFALRIDRTVELDELWLVARREDRLQQLAEALQHSCRIFPLDLGRRKAFKFSGRRFPSSRMYGLQFLSVLRALPSSAGRRILRWRRRTA